MIFEVGRSLPAKIGSGGFREAHFPLDPLWLTQLARAYQMSPRKPQVLGGYPWPSPLKRSAAWLLYLRLTLRAIAASWGPTRSLPSIPSPHAGKSWMG